MEPGADQMTARYDYMSKEELLEVARNSVKEMKYLKQKCQRFDEYRAMTTAITGRKESFKLHFIPLKFA